MRLEGRDQGVSAEVGRLVREITALECAPSDGIGDDTVTAQRERMELLTLTLAQEPNRTIGDGAAKLAVLCRRLRQDARPYEPWHMATYLLAESARDGWV